ncbi:hypothetical protein D3C87_299500 [compost metagenome]
MAYGERMSFNLVMSQPESPISVFLHDILEKRRVRNPKYSMRAFARDLGLSAGRLSDILTGRRVPGKELTRRISESLKLTEPESIDFERLIEKHRSVHVEQAGAHQLRDDEFSIVADWEHFALLKLLQTSDFQSDFSWIAQRLGISEERVGVVMERLQRLGLVSIDGGRWQAVHSKVTTPNEVPSEAVREHHKQSLERSIHSLLTDDVSLRSITSIIVPANMEKLEDAKNAIRDFRRKMAGILAEGERTEVYALNIQLVPMTKIKGKKS